MSKEIYIEILGVDYYNEINNHCKNRIGKDIQDIGWRDGTNWLSEIGSFLKENFGIGVSRKVNGLLGGWCHGAIISDSDFEIVNLNEEETIREEIPRGVRFRVNPKRVVREVSTNDEFDFDRWLKAVKVAMDYAAETKGIQKTLFV